PSSGLGQLAAEVGMCDLRQRGGALRVGQHAEVGDAVLGDDVLHMVPWCAHRRTAGHMLHDGRNDLASDMRGGMEADDALAAVALPCADDKQLMTAHA